MTVKGLINILQTMPQDALVVTEGYEDGTIHWVKSKELNGTISFDRKPLF